MKRFTVFIFLIAAFISYSRVQAQFKVPDVAWGLSVCGSHGSNDGSDNWGLGFRGFLQGELISPMLAGQIGAGYAHLGASGVYTAETGIIDLRLLFSPFSLRNLNPYLYLGLGVSKDLNGSGSDFLPLVPMGAGIQAKIANGVLLDVTGGYNLSLSDKLDGIARSSTDLNPLTNGKQDGFYGFSIGLAFALGNGDNAGY